MAKSGGCSTKEKALVASTLIEPSNIVAYLIIDDDEKGEQNFVDLGKKEWREEDSSGQGIEDDESDSFELQSRMEKIETMMDDATDDEPVPIPEYLPGSEREGSRILRHYHPTLNAKLPISILHVTSSVGSELRNYVMKETAETRQAGGTKILLNNKEPPPSVGTIFLWCMMFATVFCAGCCCLVACVNNGYMMEDEAPPPPRPVRRRLTHQQVRENFPAFHFHPEDFVECPLEDCAICLDEFEPDVRCRKLHCGHVFHSTCIARWLIERSAVCPLCKADYYEEEEEEEEEEEASDRSEAEAEPPTERRSLLAWLGNTSNQDPSPIIDSPPSPSTDANPTQNEANDEAQQASRTQSSWWPFSYSNTPTQDTTEPGDEEEQPLQRGWRFNWFGRQRRRSTMAGMTMTELSEPLMAGERLEEPISVEHTEETTATEEESEPTQLLPETLSTETEAESQTPST